MGVQFGMEEWTIGPQCTAPCQISPPLVQRVASAGQKTSHHPLSNLNTGALRCTQCCGNKHAAKKLKTGLVASYDIWPANGVGIFLFWHFINLLFIYLLTHLTTYLEPRANLSQCSVSAFLRHGGS